MIRILVLALVRVLRWVFLLWENFGAAYWAAFLRFLNWTGIIAFVKYVWAFLALQLASGVLEVAVRSTIVFLMLGAWAIFLFAMFNIPVLGVIKEAISANPFADVYWLSGSLYLASHAFPFRFAFGVFFSYLVWRISLIHAALVFNRTVILIFSGVKF